ncbi:APC family permease [Dongshaea marina]|uniref:APC family permease n=1 Tax=Dongshaea marina TaxID=2047966 RepID=UPI000D3E119C|nr:APC family permease [Dongshaea marina]
MKDSLKPKFGLFTALAMVVGTVVGIGIYFKATPVLVNTGGSESYALIAWSGGALLAIIAGIVVSELASMTKDTGGLQSFGEQTWGKTFGFMIGWSQSVLYTPLILSIIAFYSATFTLMFLGWPITLTNLMLFTYGYYIAVNAINFVSASLAGHLQKLMTLLKLIPLLGIAITGFFFSGDSSGSLNFSGASMQHLPAFIAISTAMIPVLFAFEGWIFAATVAKEIKNPQRNLPIAIIGGIVVIALVYVLFTIGLLHVAPGAEYAYNSGEVNVFSAANVLFGPQAGKVIQGFIVISALGVLNAFSLYSIRMPYSLALRASFPGSKALTKVSKRSNIPTYSALFMNIWTLLLISIGFALYAAGQTQVFDVFGDVPIALFYIFYLLIIAGIWRLRHTRPEAKRNFRAPLLPILATLAILGSAYAVYGAFFAHPYYMLGSVVIALVGVAIYKRYQPSPETTHNSGLIRES